MVLKKRLDFGFNGFQVPTIPRAPRSARRRGPQSVEDEQISAFELLASLAGKLLQESESSSASSNASEGTPPAFGKDVKQERQDEHKPLKEECLDHGSSEESVSLDLTSQNINWKCMLKEFPPANSDTVLERTSIIANSDSSVKVGGQVKSVNCASRPTFPSYSHKVEGGSLGFVESCYGNVPNGFEVQQDSKRLDTGALTKANTCGSKDPMELRANYPAMVNGDSNVKLSLFRNLIPNASFSRHRNAIELGSRDDDENFSGCNKPSNKVKAFRPPPRIGDRRIRKLLTSKYWKAAPRLRECEHYRYDGGIKPTYHKRKTLYNRERSQREALYKKRKLVDRSSVVTSDGGFSGESVSYSPGKSMNGDGPAANGVSASVIGRQASVHCKESHVKLRIKSFRVPELIIEVQETETVGSLKRTVMDAVNAILQGGLSVGVLVQGEKIRDDNSTLLQTGIACRDNLDSLGFMLEPSSIQAPPALCSGDPPSALSCETSALLTRSPDTPVLDSDMTDVLSDPPPLISSGSLAESNHESVPSHTDILTNKRMPESKALVSIPEMSVEPLAVVPMNQKTKRSELAQRRTRRPFSVSEVEALVQAVEELGTGRWRDVKLRSFEDADHRTYVDLKDKWKTLVHTAQISPQQRRGEPVPQDLLDRVLAAHSYWCHHQAKQLGKLQTSGILKITDTPTDRHGAERYAIV